MLTYTILLLLSVLSVVDVLQQRRILRQGRTIMSKADDIISAEVTTISALGTLADELATLIAAGKEDPAKLDDALTKANAIRDTVAGLVTQAAPTTPPSTT